MEKKEFKEKIFLRGFLENQIKRKLFRKGLWQKLKQKGEEPWP
jgi:hypothetical protein